MKRGSTTGRRCLWRDGWESHLIICQARDLPLRKASGGESWVLREKPPGHVGTERREDMSWAWTVSPTLFKLEGHPLYIWTKRGPERARNWLQVAQKSLSHLLEQHGDHLTPKLGFFQLNAWPSPD